MPAGDEFRRLFSARRRAAEFRAAAVLAIAIAATSGAHRGAVAEPESEAVPDAPARNVVLVFADDLGTLDLGCYGSSDLRTPNLDALAARGVRFTDFHVAAPVCSPSRAALLTGLPPIVAGVPGNVSSRRGGKGMPGDRVAISEVLRDSGRRTALFGKWHLGASPGFLPTDQGFDEFFGHLGGCIDNWSHWFYWEGPHFHDLHRSAPDGTIREVHEDGTHFAELLSREALRFVEENRERPFFLYLPFNLPHYPAQAPADVLALHADLPEPRRSYAAAVATMDRAIGRVVARIDDLGLRERTLILFLSDHGHSTEERAGFGGGNAGPFRGAKFGLFEGGIRVPAIASLPGTIPEGEIRDALATSLDLFPTILDLAGAGDRAPVHPTAGRSLRPVLASADAPSPHESLVWRLGEQWAVREGDWKLVANGRDTDGSRLAGDDALFLANLADDPGERTNLAKARPEVVARLTAIREEWDRATAR